jgi:hypothetical protein
LPDRASASTSSRGSYSRVARCPEGACMSGASAAPAAPKQDPALEGRCRAVGLRSAQKAVISAAECRAHAIAEADRQLPWAWRCRGSTYATTALRRRARRVLRLVPKGRSALAKIEQAAHRCWLPLARGSGHLGARSASVLEIVPSESTTPHARLRCRSRRGRLIRDSAGLLAQREPSADRGLAAAVVPGPQHQRGASVRSTPTSWLFGSRVLGARTAWVEGSLCRPRGAGAVAPIAAWSRDG